MVDAAMNDLIRPVLYSATHPITPVDSRRAQMERARSKLAWMLSARCANREISSRAIGHCAGRVRRSAGGVGRGRLQLRAVLELQRAPPPGRSSGRGPALPRRAPPREIRRSGSRRIGSSAMPLFPAFLKLAGRRCLVVGAGPIAEEKIESLLRAGAKVRVVAPEATERIQAWARAKKIRWDARAIPRRRSSGRVSGHRRDVIGPAAREDLPAGAASRRPVQRRGRSRALRFLLWCGGASRRTANRDLHRRPQPRARAAPAKKTRKGDRIAEYERWVDNDGRRAQTAACKIDFARAPQSVAARVWPAKFRSRNFYGAATQAKNEPAGKWSLRFLKAGKRIKSGSWA